MGNAVKFTQQGSITLRVDAQEQDSEQIQLIIEIEDTGVGISEEDRDKVFSSFEQTRSGVKSGEGTGLGLAISREYAHMMGGDITFTSQPDKGSIFRLEIRCEPGQIEIITSPQTLLNPVGLQPNQPSYRTGQRSANYRRFSQCL